MEEDTCIFEADDVIASNKSCISRLPVRSKRYYDVTFLGNKGNAADILVDLLSYHPGNISAYYEKPTEWTINDPIREVHFAQCSDQLVLSMPLGRTEDLNVVFSVTWLVTLLTTGGLLTLMITKLCKVHL